MSRSESQEFSENPVLHYFLAICCPLLLLDAFWSAHVYFCWHTVAGASSDFCNSDRVLDEETGGYHAVSAHADVIYTLLLIPVLAAFYAPFFAAALYISRRWHVSQSLTGRAYWVACWALFGFAPMAIVSAGQFLLNVARYGPLLSWSLRREKIIDEWLFLALVFGALGVIDGIFYCILAFRRRTVTLTD
jgi:hypothetical protein